MPGRKMSPPPRHRRTSREARQGLMGLGSTPDLGRLEGYDGGGVGVRGPRPDSREAPLSFVMSLVANVYERDAALVGHEPGQEGLRRSLTRARPPAFSHAGPPREEPRTCTRPARPRTSGGPPRRPDSPLVLRSGPVSWRLPVAPSASVDACPNAAAPGSEV